MSQFKLVWVVPLDELSYDGHSAKIDEDGSAAGVNAMSSMNQV